MKEEKDLINEFLDGNLSDQDLKTFQEQMMSDSALSEKVNIVRGLRNAITIDKMSLQNKKELKDTLSKMGDKYFETTSVQAAQSVPSDSEKKVAKSRSLFSKLAVAASLALLIFGCWYFISGSAVNFDKLISSNFVETSSNLRSAKSKALLPGDEVANNNANLEKEAKQADQLFKEKKYAEAKNIYNNLLTKHQDPIYKAIYNGININYDAMTWNSVLIEVGLGNNKAAQQKIEALLKSDIPKKYKDRAEALAERLNGL